MSGAIRPLPLFAFMAWCSVKKGTGATLPFAYTYTHTHTHTHTIRAQIFNTNSTAE